jgi:DNA-binding SARP family transcriptional activator
MQFHVLGPMEVYDGDRRVVLGGPKPRSLLAILLLRRGEVVPADQLIEHLYGGVPPLKAAKSIHAHVSRLRKSVGDERVRTAGGGYAVEVARGELDIDRFDELAERGRFALVRGDPRGAAASFAQALALWRGPPFADFRYSDFAQAEIGRLEGRRIGIVEDRIEAELALGQHAELVPELEGIIAEYPLRERPRAQLMLALYRSGRQAEALEAYADARRILTDELGLDPSDELKTLQRAILEHDPSLTAPTRIALESPVPGRSDFIGRSSELSRLHQALEDALAGRGRLVLVSGDPGIGKSRLADELIADARRRGVRVLVGRCWEAGGAPVYWPWIQSLRVYIRECDPALLWAQLGAGASDLAQLFPELHELFPQLPTPPSIESEGARFRLFDATAMFLNAAAREAPWSSSSTTSTPQTSRRSSCSSSSRASSATAGSWL